MFAHRRTPRLPSPSFATASAIVLAFLAFARAWAQEAAPATVNPAPADAPPASLPSADTSPANPAAPDATPANSTAAADLESSVALQLANSHDLPGLYSALWTIPDQQGLLFLGFGTPEGRAFLLQKIADPTEPHDHRVTLTDALRVDGPVYQSKFSHITPASWDVKGPPDPKNSSYFTRLAQLAFANAGDEELSLALLRTLNWLALGNTANRDPEIQADWDDAADILRQFYAQTKSERERYAIEQLAVLISADAYAKLASKSGPVLSLVTQADKYQPPPTPGAVTTGPAIPPRVIDLLVNYEYQTLPGADKITKANIVLEPVHPGPAYVFPQRVLPLTPGTTSGSGAIHVILPSSIVRGQYRVYFMFLADRRDVVTGSVLQDAVPGQVVQDVVSAGHGVTTVL